FLFSRRRGHTSSTRDWSSDVCSSDLRASAPCFPGATRSGQGSTFESTPSSRRPGYGRATIVPLKLFGCPNSNVPPSSLRWPAARSEERRVGRVGGGGGARDE